MKLRSFRIFLGVIIVTTAAGSFIAASVRRDKLSESQVTPHCPISSALTSAFKTQAETLKKAHLTARRKLGRCLLDPNTPDEAIRHQADIVIKADNDRFRFVIHYLLHRGSALSTPEKRQLFEYCGQIMRDAHRPPQPSKPQAVTDHSGPRVCDGSILNHQLQLTPKQLNLASRANPHFAQEVKKMAKQVCHSHHVLVCMLQDCNSPDQAILNQTQTFLTARSRLEQRTVDYIVAIRPCLTRKQIKQLTGMCNH